MQRDTSTRCACFGSYSCICWAILLPPTGSRSTEMLPSSEQISQFKRLGEYGSWSCEYSCRRSLSASEPVRWQCCTVGQYYATNTQGGKCCPDGYVLNMDTCEKNVTVSQPGCTPHVCAGPCTLSPVCGDGKTNGLNYGSCYVMTFPDGKQLGRRRDDWNYEKDGYIQ
jgi:hypothetical protein